MNEGRTMTQRFTFTVQQKKNVGNGRDRRWTRKTKKVDVKMRKTNVY